MEQFLFTLLAIFSGTSIGAAVFASWCLWKLRKLTVGGRRRWYLHMLLIKVGVAGTFSTLLGVVIPRVSVAPSPAAYIYITFLSIAAYGLIGMSNAVADELASAESRTDVGNKLEEESVREHRTAEDQSRASLRGWEDDTRFTTELVQPEEEDNGHTY